MKWFINITWILLLTLLFVLPVSAQSVPIKIGMSLGLTGKYAELSKMQKQALRLWEKEVNDAGGILGRPVILTIYNDQSNKNIAIRIYQKMIEKDHMDLLFAPYSSNITEAVLPITENYRFPMLISGAAADTIWKQGYRYVFGIYPPASRYTLGFQEMLSVYGLTKLALISGKDPFSQSIVNGAEIWAKRLNLEILINQTLPPDPDNFIAIAKLAKEKQVQAVLMCGHFRESILMRNALKKISWYPTAYYASVGPALQAYSDHLGQDADHTFSSSQWQYYDKLPFPGAKRFYQQFSSLYGKEPSYHATTAYTAGLLLQTAISKAGNLDKNRIREILSAMDIMTPLGRYGVDRTGMQIKFFQLVIQWINDRKEVVWPIDLKTTEPIFNLPNAAGQ